MKSLAKLEEEILLSERIDCPDTDSPLAFRDLEFIKNKARHALKSLKGLNFKFGSHFFDRVNDPRNGKQISKCEIWEVIRDMLLKHVRKIFSDYNEVVDSKANPSKYANAIKAQSDTNSSFLEKQYVIASKSTGINIPSVLRWDRNRGVVFIAKTIMRKADEFHVRGADQKLAVEGFDYENAEILEV